MRFLLSLVFVASLSVSMSAQSQFTDENLAAYDAYNYILQNAKADRKTLNIAEMEMALKNAIYHPIATLKNYDTMMKYDPTGAIGFCFGRAMATHLAALSLGLDPSSVKKIFVVGDMRSGSKPEWRFHVTTIVKGPGGRWYALDPITPGGNVVPAEQWLSWVRRTWDRPGKTNAYVTSAEVAIPNLKNVPTAGEPNKTELMSTEYEPDTKAKEGVRKISIFDQLNSPRRNTFAEEVRGSPRLYDVSSPEAAEFQKAQFISTAETGANKYSMVDILINEVAHYEYKSYFLHLLTASKRLFSDVLTNNRLPALEVMRATTNFWQENVFNPRFSPLRTGNIIAARRATALERRAVEQSAEEQMKEASMRFDIIEGDIDMIKCLN